ncbi:MAG: FAD binding domain-containing protein [Gemmatimonadaceae bacterium]|nr:FAD binding domain-containing protein [Gemmatimonadaceae bacterium]
MSDLPILSYCRPGSVEGVLHALQRRGARIYAGGTDLLVALRQRHASVRTVRVLVDIKGVGDARASPTSVRKSGSGRSPRRLSSSRIPWPSDTPGRWLKRPRKPPHRSCARAALLAVICPRCIRRPT